MICGRHAAALAYAANSQFVTWIYHRWALGSFCWVPWIMWAIDGYRRGKRGFWALVPLFIAMAFLGGTLQHAALVALAVAAMWLEEALAIVNIRAAVYRAIHVRHQQSPHSRPLCRMGHPRLGSRGHDAHSVCGCILTSNRLGLHTGMHGNAANGIYPQGWLQPLFNLAAYPVPDFPVRSRTLRLDGRAQAFQERIVLCRLLRFAAGAGSRFCTLEERICHRWQLAPACGLLFRSPLWCGCSISDFSCSSSSAVSSRSCISWQHATDKTRIGLFRIATAVAGTGILAWTLASIVLALNPSVTDGIRARILKEGGNSTFGNFDAWIAGRAGRFIGDLFIWSPQQWKPLALLALALAGLRLTASLRTDRKHAGAVMVALAVFLEVTLFASRWVTWSDPSRHPLFPETAETRALERFVGRTGRTTTLIHPKAHMALTPFIPNTLAAYGIASIGGYDSIIPKGMILPNETPGDAFKLGRMGVSHLITWQGNPDVPRTWKLVWESPAMTLYENPLRVAPVFGFTTNPGMEAFFKGGACRPRP